jgi:hypothetical protein
MAHCRQLGWQIPFDATLAAALGVDSRELATDSDGRLP